MVQLAFAIAIWLSAAQGTPDAMPPGDDAGVDAGDPDAGDGLPPIGAARGCDCRAGGEPGGLALGALALVWLRRRRCAVRP